MTSRAALEAPEKLSPAAKTTADAHYDCIAETLYCLTSPGHPGVVGGHFEKGHYGVTVKVLEAVVL